MTIEGAGRGISISRLYNLFKLILNTYSQSTLPH